jgi:HemY protein
MWLAENPGQVSLIWHGYVVETSAAVLIIVIAVIVIFCAFTGRIWTYMRGAPAGVIRFRRDGRRRRGYLALCRGLVAVAAGDPGEACRQARQADDLLDEPTLTMILSAQAAQLNGDEEAAQKFFTEMLNSPSTKILGLRGLLNQAIKLDHTQDALKWARRAIRRKPESAWAAHTLFDLASRCGLWMEADEALALATRKKTVPVKEARRSRAVLGHLMSVDAKAAGDVSKALKLSKKASGDVPGFSPVQIHYAGMLGNVGKQRRAVKALETAWATTPVPEIAEAYWRVSGANDAMARVKAAQILAKFNPKNPATAMMLAQASLDAGLWGEARKRLKAIEAKNHPLSGSYCQLMASLEEGEHQDMEAAREWLVRATRASPDPTWICEDCGNASESWTPLCSDCGGFDKFYWRVTARVPGLIAPEPPKRSKLNTPATLQDVDAVSTTQ